MRVLVVRVCFNSLLVYRCLPLSREVFAGIFIKGCREEAVEDEKTLRCVLGRGGILERLEQIRMVVRHLLGQSKSGSLMYRVCADAAFDDYRAGRLNDSGRGHGGGGVGGSAMIMVSNPP